MITITKTWDYPHICRNGHTVRSEADVLYNGAGHPECRRCNRERTQRRRQSFIARGLTYLGRTRALDSAVNKRPDTPA